MTTCKKCKKPKRNSLELCLSCYQKKSRSEKKEYGRIACPSCGKTISRNYRYCWKCNKKTV